MKTQLPTKKILIGILGVSVVLRVVAALYLGNSVEILPGTYDQISYHNLAIRLLEGHGFTFNRFWWPATPAGEPTAHWSYLYTFFISAIYTLLGPNPLAARIIQAVIVGILHPYLTFRLGRLVFNEITGLIAAAITAIYAYFIYYSASLMTEPFYIIGIIASLFVTILLARPEESSLPGKKISDAKLAILLGVLLGITILLRQLFMLIAALIIFWIIFARWRSRRNIPFIELTLSVLVIAAMILPFTIYNYTRFGRFVLLNTNAGFAFFWGNHPIHGTNFYDILPSNFPSYQDLIPHELRNLDEAALDQALLRKGVEFVLADPGRYILLSISRIPDYFTFWPTSDSGVISNLSRMLSFTLFMPFMIYGLILALLNQAQKKSERWLTSPVSFLILYSLAYTGIHLLTWTLIRYRLPVDAVMIIYAGYAIYVLADRLMAKRPLALPQAEKTYPNQGR